MKKISFLLFGYCLLYINSAYSLSYEDAIEKSAQTAIKITTPNRSTVWMSPSLVKIEWDTENIPADKTIQFYLSKDDMVVQELGIFKNNQFIDDVTLDRGLSEGDDYRVFGIELFPADKYSIAKFATPMFTIKKAPRKDKIITKTSEDIIVKVEENKPIIRSTFDGRNLNYVNEVKVYNENIKINLRDHGRVDGDIVSIYLNGVAIVSEYLLTYRNKTFEVKLDPTKPNDLFLYAHNLGKSPPNTVAIEIKDGPASEKIILNSDLKSCEAIIIKVGGGKPQK